MTQQHLPTGIPWSRPAHEKSPWCFFHGLATATPRGRYRPVGSSPIGRRPGMLKTTVDRVADRAIAPPTHPPAVALSPDPGAGALASG
jgi:hypothetical protein